MKKSKVRVRYSVRQLQEMYEKGNRKPLEDLWRAWKGIKELPVEDKNSYFNLAGYHGEPFTGAGAYVFSTPSPTDSTKTQFYWGGYCNHGNVLFPTWHRVYVLKIEEALRTIEPDATLPYWDETSEESLEKGIPWVLTKEMVELDGEMIKNPLISYTFPARVDDLKTDSVGEYAYTKPQGYTTVRYPLSGLVGTEEARTKTLIHNDKYPSYEKNVELLNRNVKSWLFSGKTSPAKLKRKKKIEPLPNSIYDKYANCIDAPNYTAFSNTTSAAQWNQDNAGLVVALESPHNDIHLSVGGYDVPGAEFGLVAGANGDMGENNTASFDPIFFFHHCNVDRMFWVWQQRNGKMDNFEIIPHYPGTSSSDSQGPTPTFPLDAQLGMDSPLVPFLVSPKVNQRMYTSRDVINIEKQLGFTYSDGSLDDDSPELLMAVELGEKMKKTQSARKLKVSGINRELFGGSFVINAYAEVDGEKIFLGSDSILSRWSVKKCANCLTHLEVISFFPLRTLTEEQVEQATFSIEINHRGSALPSGLSYQIEVLD